MRPARADEATRLRVSHGYSIGHPPLMVMRGQGLIEQHVARFGLGKLTVEWHMADGGNNINDAMLRNAKNPAAHRVLSTAAVLRTMSILVTRTERRFAEANPGLVGAFLGAREEANGFITSDPEGAVTARTKASRLKMPREESLAIFADPENAYSTTPYGSLIYASFLAQTGVLKLKPVAWTDLFLPALHGRQGS